MHSLLIAAMFVQASPDVSHALSRDVRVGIVAFDDFRGDFEQSRKLLSEISAIPGARLRFRVAIGTYGDVAHWLKHGLIDVALVSPGLFAESLVPTDQQEMQSPTLRYLASVAKPPAVSTWAGSHRRENRAHESYRAVCVVAAESPLRSFDDLRKADRRGEIRFLAVHPLSVSSHIAARFALEQAGFNPRPEQFEFTQSHTASLRELNSTTANSPTGSARHTVAFSWDDALRQSPELTDSLRAIRFPELDSLEIPTDVVVARADFSEADQLRSLLLEHSDADGQRVFLDLADAGTRYRRVREWMMSLSPDIPAGSAEISLEEIGRLLLHHSRTQSTPPRLALVLSGGGAKCAYQVGAVSTIEEHFAALRRDHPDAPVDFSLVVGTSGGAINALPIALGISSTPEGRDEFLNVWAKLDQRQIVRPARIVRGNIGLWFAIFQAAVALWFIRRFVPQREKRGWVFGSVFAGLALFEILLRYLNFTPWSMLGYNHWFHHAWLWMSFGIGASAWSVLALGIGVLIWQYRLRKQGDFLHTTVKRATWLVAAFLLGLPLLQVITVLFFQDSLSGGEGIEQALAQNFPALIDNHLQRRGRPKLTIDTAASNAARLHDMSRQIIEQGALERDLVITGSCLEQSAKQELPTDLYFHAASRIRTNTNDSDAPPFGPRGISLAAHPRILLDVVMGSGSIFPMFPARRLRDVPSDGDHVELVDGGFAHNSPVEAAVLWGATHILVIEASPRTRAERKNFLQNAAASFEHLYEQAQLQDARSRGKVSIFTLAPDPPHLCVLDFSDNLIRLAAEKGRTDASGQEPLPDGSSRNRPRFRKELGEPIFAQN